MTASAWQPTDREHRRRVLKRASILVDVDTSEIACTVRNQTEGGAELQVPLGSSVPDEFLLYVPLDRTAYACAVRWRRNDRIGVRFMGTAPKPHWHYG
ncbi:MAG TPA: PilZ domain-containing protein [Rhizobiales bacterium]|nr:PilZ domain-containing protein [Hyphomicrobiales bacterium]